MPKAKQLIIKLKDRFTIFSIFVGNLLKNIQF